MDSFHWGGRYVRCRGTVAYSLLSESGHITIVHSPRARASSPEIQDAAADLVARLSNQDIQFWGMFEGRGSSPPEWAGPERVRLRDGSAASRIMQSAAIRAAALPGLIKALQRPESFLAAHVLLTEIYEEPSPHLAPDRNYWDWTEDWDSQWLQGLEIAGTGRGRFNGLHFSLDSPKRLNDSPFYEKWPFICPARPDLTDLPALLDQWSRRLDEPMVSARWEWLVLATLVLPLLCLSRLMKTRWNTRKKPVQETVQAHRFAAAAVGLVRPISTGLSLMLCIAILILWARSRRHEVIASVLVNGQRYTTITAKGKIGLFAPPAPAHDPTTRQMAEMTVAALRNDDLWWKARFTSYDDPPLLMGVYPPGPRRGTASKRAETGIDRRDLVRPLLAALENPNRFVAAHVLLLRHSPQWKWEFDEFTLDYLPCEPISEHHLGRLQWDDNRHPHTAASWGKLDLDGLQITFNRWLKQLDPWMQTPEGGWMKPDGNEYEYTSNGGWEGRVEGDADLSSLPVVRAQWHRRLDVQLAFVPLWPLAAAAALLPLATAHRLTRQRAMRRREERRGLCSRCGYDLRASKDRCPECGKPIPGWNGNMVRCLFLTAVAVSVAMLTVPLKAIGASAPNAATQPADSERKPFERIATIKGVPFHILYHEGSLFTPDGRLFLIEDPKGDLVRLLNARTLKPVTGLLAHPKLDAFSITADGKTIFTAGGPEVRLWDVTTSKLRTVVKADDKDISFFDSSRDGTRFLTVGQDDSMLSVWDAGRSPPTRRYQLRFGTSIISAQFDPTGTYIACSEFGGRFRLLRADTGRDVWPPLETHPNQFSSAPYSAQFDPSGKRLAVPLNGGFRVLECNSGRTLTEARWDPDIDTNGIRFSPDGSLLVITAFHWHGLADGPAEVFDAATGRRVHEIGACVMTCEISPDDRLALCNNGRNSGPELFDLQTGARVQKVPATDPTGLGAMISPDWQTMLVGWPGDTISVWRPRQTR